MALRSLRFSIGGRIEKTLKDYGFPPTLIELSSLSAKAIVEGEFDKTSDPFELIISRKPISLANFPGQQYGDENN
ncbi:hypothetical protein MRBLMN1_000025 [Chitinophaga ginsengisegetis]|uniref:hypothetical protein n=1 Tax=Chitinophaga ginsengisegetis TaxID=393003 RepID=UPI00343D7F14